MIDPDSELLEIGVDGEKIVDVHVNLHNNAIPPSSNGAYSKLLIAANANLIPLLDCNADRYACGCSKSSLIGK